MSHATFGLGAPSFSLPSAGTGEEVDPDEEADLTVLSIPEEVCSWCAIEVSVSVESSVDLSDRFRIMIRFGGGLGWGAAGRVTSPLPSSSVLFFGGLSWGLWPDGEVGVVVLSCLSSSLECLTINSLGLSSTTPLLSPPSPDCRRL